MSVIWVSLRPRSGGNKDGLKWTNANTRNPLPDTNSILPDTNSMFLLFLEMQWVNTYKNCLTLMISTWHGVSQYWLNQDL